MSTIETLCLDCDHPRWQHDLVNFECIGGTGCECDSFRDEPVGAGDPDYSDGPTDTVEQREAWGRLK